MYLRPNLYPPPRAPGADWRAHYDRCLVSAEEAVGHVRSGDLVAFASGREPLALGLALAARVTELRDVTVYVPTPGRDFGWYDPGWEEYVQIQYMMNLPVIDEMTNERRADCVPTGLLALRDWVDDVRKPDVLLVEISSPDDNGFCSFGVSVWDKRQQIAEAKLVLAEVNPHLIRTCGENYVHATEIDYFVQHTPSGRTPASADLLGREPKGFPPHVQAIAQHVGSLIHDGDTLQIGVGTASEPVALLANLEQHNDLGWHSQATPRGIIHLVIQGVISGARKTLHPGVAVACSLGGGTKEEMDFVHLNPMFALYNNAYVEDPRVIAAHDNLVAINNALALDLSGQIASETIGRRIFSSAGGQTTFAVGALLSRGGRSITVLPSLTSDGHSRIVPTLSPGTAVTVPRGLADLVVTEHGIARLRGRTYRQRAEALIAIAHPDHRDELHREARQLFWPS